MPPRYAYWTILVDGQPTAFRASAQEDLMPTFKRLQAKHPSAEMQWFQNGKLWPSRVDAQEAMLARGERGRMGDARQGGFRDRKREWSSKTSTFAKAPVDRQDSRPRTQDSRPKTEKLDWKPKGEFTPAPKRADRPEWKPNSSSAEGREPRRSAEREGRPAWTPKSQAPSPKPRGDWKPKGSFDRERKPEWKPKGEFTPAPKRADRPDWKPKADDSRPRTFRPEKPEWKPKTQDSRPKTFRSEKPDWKPKGSFDRDRKPAWGPKTSRPQDLRTSRPEKPEWKPRTEPGTGDAEPGSAKRKWVPKEEYKKSMGISAPRDSKWRPGGAHRDPKQKYKDAKKAKWTKFKKTIRARSGARGKKKSDE